MSANPGGAVSAGTPVDFSADRRGRASIDQVWVWVLVLLLALELLYFSLTSTGFWGGGSGMLSASSEFLDVSVMALGLALVIFAGEIDLSIGAMASLSGIVMAQLWHVEGLNIWLATLITLVMAAGLGALNGFIITKFGIGSLLVTLATQFIFSSVATAVSGESPPYGFPKEFLTITGTGTIGPIPADLVIFAVLALFTGLLVSRTRYGRSLVLIGHNRPAARYSGVNVSRTLIWAFIGSALFAGIAGIMIAGVYNAVRDDVGIPLLLPSVTIVVLGGVDIFGGKGRITGVIIASIIIGYVSVGLLDGGSTPLTVTMVQGIVLIIGLIIKISLDRRGGLAFRDALGRFFARQHLGKTTVSSDA